MAYYYPSGPLGPVCDVVLTEEQKQSFKPILVDPEDPYVPIMDWGDHPDYSKYEDITGEKLPWRNSRLCKKRVLPNGFIEYYDCIWDWDYRPDKGGWDKCIDPDGVCFPWSPYHKDTFGLYQDFYRPRLNPDTCVPFDPDINILPQTFYTANGTAVTRYKKAKSAPITFPVTSTFESILSDDLLDATFDPNGNIVITSDTAGTSGTIILDFLWSDNPNAYDTALGTYSVGGQTFTQTPGVRHGTAQTSFSVTAGSTGSGPQYSNTYNANITDNSGGFLVQDDGKKLCFKDLHGNDCNATVEIRQVNTTDVQSNATGYWSDEGNKYAVWVNPQVCTLPGLVQEISYTIDIPSTDTYGFTFGCDYTAEIYLNGSTSTFMTANPGGIFRTGPYSTPYTSTTTLNEGENTMVVRITNDWGLDNTWNVNPAGIGWVVRDSSNNIVTSSLQCTAAGNSGQGGTNDWVRTGPPDNAAVPWTQFLDDYAIYRVKPANDVIDPYLNTWQEAEAMITIPSDGSYTIEFQSDNKSKFSWYDPIGNILYNEDVAYTSGLGTQTYSLSNLTAGDHRLTFEVINLYRGDPYSWDVNPGGYYIKICRGSVCAASTTNVTWVPSSPHMDWSDFMNTYAVFSSNQNTYAGVTQTATWNVVLPVAGNYELEVQGDNTVVISWDGTTQGTVGSFQTSTTYTFTGATAGNHIITAAVDNATGFNDHRWGNNPAGVAWVLRQTSGEASMTITFDSNGNILTSGNGEGNVQLDLTWDEDITTYNYTSNVQAYFDGQGNLVCTGSGFAELTLNFAWADNPGTASTALGTYSVAGASFTQNTSVYSGSDSATVTVYAGETYECNIVDSTGGFTIRNGGAQICFKDFDGDDCNATVTIGNINNQSGSTNLYPNKALGTYAVGDVVLVQGNTETGSVSGTLNVRANKTYPAVILENPAGFDIQNNNQRICFKDSTGWVRSIDGPSGWYETTGWSSFLKTYGIYPSNTDTLVGTPWTATWTYTVTEAGNYVFECQSDNAGSISWNGSTVITTTEEQSYNVSSYHSLQNVSPGTYTITATITNMDRPPNTWSLNPAGIAWTLRNPSNTIVISSLSPMVMPCKAQINVGTFTATNAIIATSLDLNSPGDGNLLWHTRMATGYEYSLTP